MVTAHRALMLRSLRYDKSETFETGRDLRDLVAWLEHTKVMSLAPGTGTVQVWSIQTLTVPLSAQVRQYPVDARGKISDVKSAAWPATFSQARHQNMCAALARIASL